MEAITRVRIKKENTFMGKGVKELLDAIEKHHSIKKASEFTRISYPKAVRMIKTMEKELGFSVVNSEKGGSQHGGTVLTEKGRELLGCYREIEKAVQEYAQKLVDERFNY